MRHNHATETIPSPDRFLPTSLNLNRSVSFQIGATLKTVLSREKNQEIRLPYDEFVYSVLHISYYAGVWQIMQNWKVN